jgi:hypothetical protein
VDINVSEKRTVSIFIPTSLRGVTAQKNIVTLKAGSQGVDLQSLNSHRHHNEYNQGLGIKTFSFKAQVVFGLSIFVLVFPNPSVPEVGTGKPPSIGGFCPFVPGGLTISLDTILCSTMASNFNVLRVSGFL